MTYIVVACFILNAGFLLTLGTYAAIKLILWLENKYYSEQKKNNTHTAQDSPMTSREKAIAGLIERLKPLNNSQLADIILRTYDGDFICHYCIHNVDYEWTRRNWTCRAKGTCQDGVKRWLEQEQP